VRGDLCGRIAAVQQDGVQRLPERNVHAVPLTGCATTAAQPAAPPGAQAANDEAVLSPLAVVPLGEVNPVLGADTACTWPTNCCSPTSRAQRCS
jgi:hypothetical protein